MTNFETQQYTETSENFNSIESNWKSLLNSKFKQDYPAFGDLGEFINKSDKNPFEESLMHDEIPKLIEIVKELISKSKKTPLSIPEIQYLLKEENLIFIPLEIKEGLQNKIREKIVEKSRNLDDIFLNKDKIGDYIKNNGSNFLLDYIKYLTGLEANQRDFLSKYLKNNNDKESYKKLSFSTIEKLSIFTPFINSEKSGLFPIEFKKNLNTTIFELIKSGNLNSLNIYTYSVNEDGILGLGNKVSKIGVDYSKDKEKPETKKSYTNYESLEGYSDILEYYVSNLETLELLINKDNISDEDLIKFSNIYNNFINLSDDFKEKNGFLPWEILETSYKFEKIQLFLRSKNNKEKTELEHSQKMSRFLQSAITWMESEDNSGWRVYEKDTSFDEKKIEKLKQFLIDINNGKVISFKQINDSTIEDYLGSFFEELSEAMETRLGDNGSISKDLEKKGLADSYWKDIDMDRLDKFVDNFGDGGDWDFSKIETATAQLMVDNSTNNKTPAFNLMLRNILKKNNIDISNNAIKERKEEISRDVNVNQYIGELLDIPRIEQEQILLKNGLTQEEVNNLNNIEIKDKVLEVIKDKSAEKGAEMMLYLEKAQILYDSGQMNGDNALFFKEFGDWKNNAAEITTMIVKEAIIMTVATALTGGLGTIAAGSLLALNGASKVARVINLSRNGINGGTGILAKTARLGTAGSKLGLDTLAYLAVSDTVYEGDQLTLENFIHTYSMFLGGFVGLKLGNKLIKPTDANFAKQLKIISGGAVGGTVAGTGILVFGNSSSGGITEIDVSEVGNMMVQGMLMGGLLMPLMKGGHNIGKWSGNKTHKVLDSKFYQSVRDSNQASLNAKTGGKTDFYSGQRKSLIDSLKTFRNDNKIINFGKVQKKIDHLLIENQKLDNLKKSDFQTKESELTTLKSELQQYRIDLAGKIPGKNREGLKKSENKVQELEKEILNTRSEIRRLEERLDKYIKDELATEDAIKNLPEAHPIKRLIKETAVIKDRIPLYIAEKWNNVRLERIKLIEQNGTSEWLGNGFYLKKGTTITNSAGKDLFTLPKGVKIESVEQLNIGNNRITALKTEGGELIRIYKEANGIPSKLMEKVLNGESNIQGVYNKSNSKLEGYKVIEGGKSEYYTLSGNKSKKDSINTNKYFEKTIASSGKISNAELKLSGIEPNELGKIRRNWDSKFNEVMTDSTINNLKDSWIKGLKSIKNNPKSTPEQLKQADSLLKKVALMPVSIIKGILSKGLWAIGLAGGGIIGLDYYNDGDVEWESIAAFGGTLITTDVDVLKSVTNKTGIPTGWITGLLEKYPKSTWLARLGGAYFAMTIADKGND